MRSTLPKIHIKNNGQTLLSLLLALAIFAILANAIFTLTTSSFRLVSYARARISARHLAQERIELIRNLPYDEVGTIGGIPGGDIPQTENVVRNGLNYEIRTSIVYVDNSFDETAPNDLLPTDFKRVRVDISWEGLAASRLNPVVLATDVAPRGIETTEGGGTLSIHVFDANTDPVAQADVHIVADSLDPRIDIEVQTNDNGFVVLPGAPACTGCYFIEVTKDGYSTDRTYSTTEVTNPDKPYANVIEGDLTEIPFSIDKFSTLNIATVSDRNSGFTPIPNITFNLRGETKIIGTDVNDFPIYKFDKEFTTDAGGNIIITDVEWDNFIIAMPQGTSYDIAGTNPLNPYSLLPDSEVDWDISLYPHSSTSILAIITGNSDTPIASASSRLSSGSFETYQFSGLSENPDFGQSFFPNLSPATYYFEATASGYLYTIESVQVSGTTIQNFPMNPD